MQLRDLPAEILTAVLRKTLRYPDYDRRLERNLPLMAVCRWLRYIALPIVYEEAYVDAFDDDSTWRAETRADWPTGKSGLSKPSDQEVYGSWVAISNVEHIASMGYTGLVQHMRIELEAGYWHVVGMRLAVRHLCNVASKLQTVKRLEICMNGPTFGPNVPFDDSYSEDWDNPEDADEYARHALALWAMMPNVHGLDFADYSIFPVPAFGWQLAQHYRQQLQTLRFTVSPDEKSYMDSAPAAQDGHSIKLSFPLLRSARIYCFIGQCPVLDSAVFPCSMGTLNIQISAPAWQSISHMELPVARRLKLGITSPDYSDPSLPLSFNRLLTNSHQCGKVMMCADVHNPSAYLPGIAFTGLTGLVVDTPISADMVIDIIGKLPRLETLIASQSTNDPIQADIAIPGPGECHPVEPLGAKLQRLSYGQQYACPQSHANIKLYRYLLPKLPSLRWLDAGDEQKIMLAPFFKAYQEWYPHLAGVNFCAKRNRRF
ncbi:hypothetical protein H4R19_000716 [Coemansia spiralis]|nr:hypothetical protein H4R19_000716 [Coemansia spiralis]